MIVFDFIILLSVLLGLADTIGKSNCGKEFIFGFLPNINRRDLALEILVTTKSNGNVHVNVSMPLHHPLFFETIIVSRTRAATINIDIDANNMVSGELDNKGIYVESDEDITLVANNYELNSNDAFLVLPVAVLGHEYYVLSWNIRTAFLLIGISDTTSVKIQFGKFTGSVNVNGTMYGPKDSLVIYLNKLETLLFTDGTLNGDLTGSYILANKPVSLISGSICANVYLGACDHLSEHIRPIENWGYHYVTIGMPNCHQKDTYRIMTSSNETEVTISGSLAAILQYPGDFYQFNVYNLTTKTISADKPILVALYASGGCYSNFSGDPSMMILPPVNQYASDYVFSCISSSTIDFENSVAIVIREEDIHGLIFDDRNISQINWWNVDGKENIKFTEFRISNGTHYIRHLKPSVTFLAVATGIHNYISYGYLLGQDFDSLSKRCNDTTFTISPPTMNFDSCDFGLDPCSENKCLNNGTCVPIRWVFIGCICPENFIGQICEIGVPSRRIFSPAYLRRGL